MLNLSVRHIRCRKFVPLKKVDQSSPKSRKTCYTPIPLKLPNLVALRQKNRRYPLLKFKRKSRPNFVKFGEHVSTGQTPNHAKFHRARSNDVRAKRYNFFTPFSILALQGDLLCQSSRIWMVTYSKAPLYEAAKFRPVLKTMYKISATKVRRFP